MSVRNFVLAQKAWGEWSWCYEDLDYPLHFAKGFKDGYRNILEGGNGCQPTLPPKCYWKPQFQSPEGRCKTTAWFDGFSHGALAAQQDGYGSLQEIPISPTARANLMTRLSTPAAFPFQGMSTPSVPAPDSMIEVPRQMPDTQLQQAIPLPTMGDGESLNGPAVPPVRSYEE
ncbi:MAG: hypothetical protein R3C20_19620 [Planctomycetaceae bacterium]